MPPTVSIWALNAELGRSSGAAPREWTLMALKQQRDRRGDVELRRVLARKPAKPTDSASTTACRA